MLHAGASGELLISVKSDEANYKKPGAESNKWNEIFLQRKSGQAGMADACDC
jgi:hypothetical protein